MREGLTRHDPVQISSISLFFVCVCTLSPHPLNFNTSSFSLPFVTASFCLCLCAPFVAPKRRLAQRGQIRLVHADAAVVERDFRTIVGFMPTMFEVEAPET
jgi:hypothetical protein